MRARLAAPFAVLFLALSGCASAPAASQSTAPQPAPDETGAGHGEIAGARELAEPALHLATVDGEGIVHHLDLLDEEASTLAEIDPVDDLVSNGRYLFAIRDGSVTVIDSGVWTWSHIDHFHYYEAPPRVIGEVEGSGVATVVPGEIGTGILFDDEAVLLDTLALADGEIEEQFRIEVAPHAGLAVPLNEGAVITAEPDAEGHPQALRVIASDGTPGERIACADAAGTITTVVGVVIGCADGAALAVGAEPGVWERVPYPDGVAPAATAFDARKARPSVAAIAGESGVWILDTRARTWNFQDVGEPIVRAVAVDDADERVLILAADGSVLVLAGGVVASRTAPLVAESLADSETAENITFVVDQHRAYLNGPHEQLVWEIDPADGARIARTFEMATTPLLLAGTGR